MLYRNKGTQLDTDLASIAAKVRWEVKDLSTSVWRWRGRKSQLFCSISRKYWQVMDSQEKQTLKVIVTLGLVNKIGPAKLAKYGVSESTAGLLFSTFPQHLGIQKDVFYATVEAKMLPALDLAGLRSVPPIRSTLVPAPQTNGKVIPMAVTVGVTKVKARDYVIALVDQVMADYRIQHHPTVASHQRKGTYHHRPGGMSQIVFHYERLESHMKVGRCDIRGEDWLWGQRFKGLEAVHMTALHEVAHAIQRANGQRYKGSVHNDAWKRIFKELIVLYPFSG